MLFLITMKNRIGKWLVFGFALLFALLFHEQLTGINLIIFQSSTIALLLYNWNLDFRKTPLNALLVSNVILQISVVYNGSMVAKTLCWLSYILVIGSILQPEIKSTFHCLKNYFGNLLNGIKACFNIGKTNAPKGRFRIIPFLKIIVVPALILFVFSFFYRSANPVFNKTMESISRKIAHFFENMNIEFVALTVLGFLFSSVLIIDKTHLWTRTYLKEQTKTENLTRVRRKNNFASMLGLKTEYKSAVTLFIGLNALILFFNITDIQHLWFNFQWDGGFLKSFVHEGTYLLICSLILSIVVTIYCFRKNINFLQNNQLLKILAVIWLSQNILMLFSVALRNYYYIVHFALAHKRIGVYFFLAICLIGLITCIIKVWHKKSYFYLEKNNALYAYLVLVTMGCFNWDIIIAKYNFAKYKESFLHLPYMLNLSDKALPYLDYTEDQLEHIDSIQNKTFSFESRGYHKNIQYGSNIEKRKAQFISDYKERHWLSWNYADYRAFKILTGSKE